MRVLGLVLLAGCSQGVRTQTFELPLDVAQGTIFSIADVGDEMNEADRYGRIGDTERLGGPTFEVEGQRILVAQFLPTDFNGVRGPELVYVGSGERDGLDSVRLPTPERLFELVDGALIPTDEAIADLRVPCDAARAATRPSVEVDPRPRCPLSGAPVVVTCDDITRTGTVRRTFARGEDQFDVRLEQMGCRIDFTCMDEAKCAAVFPAHAILPPHGAAKKDDAFMELVGNGKCLRGPDNTFSCPDGDLVLMP